MSVGSVRGVGGVAGVLAAVAGGVSSAFGVVTATRSRSVVAAVTAGSLAVSYTHLTLPTIR
ncbi:hypothetical protein, partial [Myceligenerans indicum]|uniref:hypothetical protein n=1 Tax=Myceligenerans indicum TaxID=2593663 RepID=UPI001A91C1FB